MPTVITAIANPEAEGFVAGTLFAQGWNVIFRAIDWSSLRSYCEANPAIAANALLIYGNDLPGISKKVVDELHASVRQVIGFSIPNTAHGEFESL